MYKIVLVGFGSIGFRYYQAITKIKLPNIKIFIVDKKKSSFKKILKLNKDFIQTSNSLNFIPKKTDLCIISTTCNNRPILIKKLIKKTKIKNVILEKPLTQSSDELIKLNSLLENIKNIWVNTDRRCLKVYKYLKKKLDKKKKILIKVRGTSWGICCNSLHFVDLFNFLTSNQVTLIEETKSFNWYSSKRKGFKELDDGVLKLRFGIHELQLHSKKYNGYSRPLNLSVSNDKNNFLINEDLYYFRIKSKKKKLIFKNEFTSIKMTNIVRKILLTNKSTLPNYKDSSRLYFPLINFFLNKWKKTNLNSKKVPIT